VDPVPRPTSPAPPRPGLRARLNELRRGLFGTWYRALTTVVLVWGLGHAAVAIAQWALVAAAFGSTRESCRAVSGACWSVIADMWPVFVAGLYDFDERWRLLAAAVILAVLGVGTVVRRGPWLWAAWPVALTACFVLVYGSERFGLPVVETQKWGGLMLTLVLAAVGQTVAFPIALLLALGRRSRDLPIVRVVCVVYIELMRSVPLVTVLLMASFILPLFFPSSVVLDKLLTAQVGIIMFSAATLAEVVRGGLQGVSRQQEEAAKALGLGYWLTMRLVILPQALRLVLPALVSTFIMFVKGTSLVIVVGLYDLLGAARLASSNENWVGVTVEPLLFAGLVFWVICYSMSRYSRRLERRYHVG